MKRSGFKRPTIEQARLKALKRVDRQIALQAKKQAQTGVMGQIPAKKPKSAAAKAGAKRRREKQQVNDELEWEWKVKVRVRDNYTCQFPGYQDEPRCTKRSEHISCHHIAPRSRRKDLIYVVSNGICLCQDHHTWVHKYPLLSAPMGLLNNESRELSTKLKTSLPL